MKNADEPSLFYPIPFGLISNGSVIFNIIFISLYFFMFIILSYFFSGRNIFWIRDRIVTLILIHPPPLTPPLSFYPQSQYLSEWGERWHHRRRLLCSCSCLLPIALIITIQSKRNDFDSARAPGCVYVCPSVRMLDSILMKLRPRSAPHANSTHAPTTNDSLMSKPEIQTSSELSTIQQSSPTWICKIRGQISAKLSHFFFFFSFFFFSFFFFSMAWKIM